jgi:hypothetical protein
VDGVLPVIKIKNTPGPISAFEFAFCAIYVRANSCQTKFEIRGERSLRMTQPVRTLAHVNVSVFR